MPTTVSPSFNTVVLVSCHRPHQRHEHWQFFRRNAILTVTDAFKKNHFILHKHTLDWYIGMGNWIM